MDTLSVSSCTALTFAANGFVLVSEQVRLRAAYGDRVRLFGDAVGDGATHTLHLAAPAVAEASVIAVAPMRTFSDLLRHSVRAPAFHAPPFSVSIS